jgi:uncharacterized protein involved in outer membrane biogenesis
MGDKMRTRLIKFLGILIVVIIVILIGLTIVLKQYVTPEKVTEIIIPAAEKALKRKVQMGEVDIGLFTGIKVKDLTIKEQDGTTDFVSSDSFVIRFKLLPLLSKSVIVDELTLVSPEIRVVRNPDGRFNFSGMGTVGKEEKTKEEKPTQAPRLPVSLLISEIAVKDARFTVVDRMEEFPDVKGVVDLEMGMKSSGNAVSSKGIIDFTLHELLLRKPQQKSLKDITARLEYDASVNLDTYDVSMKQADMQFQDIVLRLSGEIKNIRTVPEIDLRISMDDMDTAKLQKTLTSFVDLPGVGLSGNLTADVNIAGTTDDLDSFKADGTVAMHQLGIVYKDIDALINGELTLDKDVVTIKRADVRVQGMPASVKGKNFRSHLISLRTLKGWPFPVI